MTGVWSFPDGQLERLRDEFPEVAFDSPSSRAEVGPLLPETDVIFGWAARPDNFHLARRLRWVHVSAAGVGPMLFPAMVESDVIVTNGRGLHAHSMAQHTLAVILPFPP